MAAVAGLRLQLPAELEPWVAEGVAARRCLPLLAALVHVPALHAAELEDAGSLPPSAPSALALQVPPSLALTQWHAAVSSTGKGLSRAHHLNSSSCAP